MIMTGLETVPMAGSTVGKPIATPVLEFVFKSSWTCPPSRGAVEADTDYLWSKAPSI